MKSYEQIKYYKTYRNIKKRINIETPSRICKSWRSADENLSGARFPGTAGIASYAIYRPETELENSKFFFILFHKISE